MPPYEWEWGWHAETQWRDESWVLTDTEIADFIRREIAKALVEKYTENGYTITVTDVSTSLSIKKERKIVNRRAMLYGVRYIIDGTTKTNFDTNAPVMSSPIDPVTAMLIISVISAVIGLATVVLYFVIFSTGTNLIRDIGTGISETFGMKGQAGLGVLFLIILLIIGLFVIGKYWKPWRKRR